MKTKIIFSGQQLEALKRWLTEHPDYDGLYVNWQDPTIITQLLGQGSQTLLPLLKAHQRLIRIIPKEHHDIAFYLLERGLHSAVQIASLSKQHFLALTQVQPEVMTTIYTQAQIKRSQIVIQYMNQLQNNEPHVKAARI